MKWRWLLLLPILLGACTAPVVVNTTNTTVTLVVDGETRSVTSTALLVRDLMIEQEIVLGALDEIQPSEFTQLESGMTVTVVRVTEGFEIEQVELPYERQTVRNETLPAGESRLLQTGVPGVEEVTFRNVYRDGTLATRSEVRRSVVTPALPEIIMIGVQSTFITIPIQGTLTYISGGNAWLMRDNSGSRRPLTLTGDIDGRVFELSSEGDWLLYTRNTIPPDLRTGETPTTFNRLYAISTLNPEAQPIDLEIDNVLWAGWSPTEPRTFAYTTGQPSSVPPGWQANNELLIMNFEANGRLNDPEIILPADEGGRFGGYGTYFVWAPNGGLLGYSRGDNLGIVDLTRRVGVVLHRFTHYNTRADWVWLPDMSFSADSRVLYTVTHGPPVALEAPEDSPVFDVFVAAVDGSFSVNVTARTGMWAAPVVTAAGDRVAYLQAIDPLDSVTGRYRLVVMDRDGSNAQVLFPAVGEIGLPPQQVSWSVDGERLAIIWQGNLWVIDSRSGVAQQLTGDGQTSSPDWSR